MRRVTSRAQPARGIKFRMNPRPGTSALMDAAGTVHAPAGADARIACLVPSITELVFALGLGDRLVARTRFCIHPAAMVDSVTAVGGTKKVNLAKLKALAPSHAILNVEENTREMEAAIREFVPHVIVTYPKRPEDNPPLFRLLGGIFGNTAEAEALAAKFDMAYRRLLALKPGLPRRRVLYFIWKKPWMGISRDTYIANALALLNWQVLGHRDGVAYPELAPGPELVAAADLVLFSTEPYPFKEADLDEFARERNCPRTKLRLIDGEYASWYGPRAIAGLDYLGELAQSIRI
jgi:ABC-type Fe3+-hydroxamate transport system substrate-binding protein